MSRPIPKGPSKRVRKCARCAVEFYDSQTRTTFGQKFCSARCFGDDQRERARAKWPPREEVVRLYVDEGLSDKALGAHFGRSYQWAFKLRQHYGIAGASLSQRNRKPLHASRDRARWGMHLKPEECCRNCRGCVGMLALHHVIPRSMCRASKYDLRNGVPLCTHCHLGWHHRRVTLYRDIFTEEEWAYISSVKLTGQEIGPWLDERYPVRDGGLENARVRVCPSAYRVAA